MADPMYVLLFVSKAHNLRGALQRSYLSEYLPLDDAHELHTFCGSVVGVEVVWHSFWHLLRWLLSGEIHLMWQHVTGRSGLVALALTPLVVWPMLFPRLRTRIKFETRKKLHYLSVGWGVALCFHAPKRHIAYIMGCAVGVYGCDWLWGSCFRVNHLLTLRFTRLGKAVQVEWENPPNFDNSGAGYIYLCLAAVGDWTMSGMPSPSSCTPQSPTTRASASPPSATGRWRCTPRSPSR